jgi:predicted HTH transcriptional regulator
MKDTLTPQERLERIAAIINKGIYMLALKEGWFVSKEIKEKSKAMLEERQKIIMAHVKSNGKITNKEVCELLAISRDTAHRELRYLLESGLLEVRGRGRSVVYFK